MSAQRTVCPKCGEEPTLVRVGTKYWKAKCPTEHFLTRIEAHAMKTQREAWEQWEVAYGSKAAAIALSATGACVLAGETKVIAPQVQDAFSNTRGFI